MARVVRQRSAPPYLLILFVFLFLVSATLAVMGYMDRDQKIEENLALEEKSVGLENEVKAVKADQRKLVKEITGKPGSVQNGLDVSNQNYAKRDQYAKQIQSISTTTVGISTGRAGLGPDMSRLAEIYASAVEANDKLKKTNSQQGEEITKLTAQIAALTDEHKTQVKGHQGELSTAKTALTTQQEEYAKSLKQMKEDIQKIEADLQEQLNKQSQENEKLILELDKKRKLIEKYKGQIVVLKRKLVPGMDQIVNEADGSIKRVARASGICYIDLGSNDKIRQGMTFAVYSRDSEKKEDAKGKIRVVRPGPTSSECKILAQQNDNPITEDDIVANLAFNVVRTYVFVIKGDFDLHGGSAPTSLGNREVTESIRRCGGKIVSGVDVQTDFVVMGAPPAKPLKPAPDAGPQDKKDYQNRLKRYQEFIDTQTAAQSLQIPLLNENRFLTFMGYMPEKKPLR